MANGKGQMWGIGLLTFVFTFTIYALPFDIAQAAECLATPPREVNHGGALAGSFDSLATKDGQGIVFGPTATSTSGAVPREAGLKSGWLVLDLGCFTDHEGADLRIFGIGRSHGAEVYVAPSGVSTKVVPSAIGNPGKSWTRIPESIPPHYKQFVCTRSECAGYKVNEMPDFCDGYLTLPEAIDGCVTGDQWFNLDISGEQATLNAPPPTTNKSYRYVYVWSNKGAHIDAIETTVPSQSVDLYIIGEASARLQFADGVSAGNYQFGATLTGLGPGKYAYLFSCDLDHTVPTKGEVKVLADARSMELGPFACSYSGDGSYKANLTIYSQPMASDSASIIVGPPKATDAPTGPIPTGKAIKWTLIILGVLVAMVLVVRYAKPHTPS